MLNQPKKAQETNRRNVGGNKKKQNDEIRIEERYERNPLDMIIQSP